MLTLARMQDLLKGDPEMPDEAVDAEYIIDNIAIVGSVDTVTRKLQDLYDLTGGFGTVLDDWSRLGRQGKNAPVDGTDGEGSYSSAAVKNV